LAIACDSIGGAKAVLDPTVAYLKTREQFGKPIGSFQALKHRCAEHKVAIEAADALVRDAVERWSNDAADAALFAALAKALACDVYAGVATDAVQLHGGIGFTWEHVCHRYLKRAKLNQTLFGGSAAHRDRAAQLLLAA
jgi:alkylation response protein AidB-like acyl-CoA dehydrogenase